MLDSRSCKNVLSSPQYSRARSAELWPRHVCQNSIMTWANHRSSVLVFLLFTFGLSSIFYFLIILDPGTLAEEVALMQLG